MTSSQKTALTFLYSISTSYTQYYLSRLFLYVHLNQSQIMKIKANFLANKIRFFSKKI